MQNATFLKIGFFFFLFLCIVTLCIAHLETKFHINIMQNITN